MYNNHRYSYEVRSRVPRVPTVKRMSPVAVVFLVLFILGSCIGSGFLGAHLVAKDGKKKPETQTTVIYRDSTDRAENLSSVTGLKTPQQVASEVAQSIVEIYTDSATYSTGGTALVSGGAGSGVIFATDGYILTAHHVVEDAEQVKVRLYNGDEYEAEWVKGDKLADIAVVKINAKTLNSATVGDSDDILSGEEILAVGNPFGSLGGTVTSGNVSATKRSVTISGKNLDNLIQLSCPLNPGDSGGGIFNMYGALVGIINGRGVGEYGNNIAFASPVNEALKLGTDLITYGYVLGRVDTEVFDVVEISKSPDTAAGLYFMGVRDNDVHTTLTKNDYIVSVAGEEVSTVEEWEKILNSRKIGEVVEIVYRRRGVEGTVTLEMKQRLYCD